MNKNFVKVPFTAETIKKCICPQCPVQGNSRCVKNKAGKLMEAMNKRGMVPESSDVPGVYCSTGIATCKDLDTKQMCVCGGCPVFDEYNLASAKPMFYYCRDGMAKSS